MNWGREWQASESDYCSVYIHKRKTERKGTHAEDGYPNRDPAPGSDAMQTEQRPFLLNVW